MDRGPRSTNADITAFSSCKPINSQHALCHVSDCALSPWVWPPTTESLVQQQSLLWKVLPGSSRSSSRRCGEREGHSESYCSQEPCTADTFQSRCNMDMSSRPQCHPINQQKFIHYHCTVILVVDLPSAVCTGRQDRASLQTHHSLCEC
jgi:hypothetical protein